MKERRLANVLLVEINAIAPLVMAQVLETNEGFVLTFDESVDRTQVDLAKATVRGFSAGIAAVLAVQKEITDKIVVDMQKEVRGR